MRRVRSRVEISHKGPEGRIQPRKVRARPKPLPLPVLYATEYTLFREQHLPSLRVKLWKIFQERQHHMRSLMEQLLLNTINRLCRSSRYTA